MTAAVLRRCATRRAGRARVGRGHGPVALPERGSALAAVVAVLAITGIIAAGLLVSTTSGMRISSGSRAHVQSLTAAEGGLDAAKRTLAACSSDLVATTASPRYSVEIWHRESESATWARGCPLADSVQIKLDSTGWSDAKAIDGQAQSDVSTMESVVRNVPAVFAGRELTVASAFAVNPTTRADIVVNGDYRCEGTGAGLTHTGVLLLGDEYAATGVCRSQGFLKTAGDYDETAEPNAFPRYTATHPRFSHLGGIDWFDIPHENDPAFVNPCTVAAGQTVTTTGGGGRIDTQVDCPAGLTVDPGGVLEFVLKGEVVVFVEQIALHGNLVVRSGDGKEHSLTIVRPWTQTESCLPEADVQLTGGTVVQSDALTRVMLYSSNTVQIGADPTTLPASRPAQAIRGQVFGCDVRVWDDTTLTFAPAGATLSPAPWGAVELLSKRDGIG